MSMISRFFYFLLLSVITINFISISQTFAQASAQKKKNPVIATVGKEKIRLNEFNRRYKEVKERTLNPPNKKVFLQDIIQYKIGVQEAKRLKLINDPVVKERINQQLYTRLIENGIKTQVDNIRVIEKEMKNWYKKNPNLRTSHILIELKSNSTPSQIKQIRNRALEILKEVKKSSRPFKDLVKLYTDDTISRKTGGDIGFQNSQTLDPKYYAAALSMKMNQVKGVIQTSYGFHIIKLTGKQSYKDADKRLIRAYVFEEKKKKIFKAFFAKIKKRYPVRTFEKNL